MQIIIKRPIISEKSMKLAGNGLYTFLVNKEADKPEIRQAIEEQFGVDVVSIKTINVKSRRKMQRNRRGYTVQPASKKALVLLKSGQKLAIFETETDTHDHEGEEIEVKEKKSLLRGTKVKIEKETAGKGSKKTKEEKIDKQEKKEEK